MKNLLLLGMVLAVAYLGAVETGFIPARNGDYVEFNGQYEWNAKGGVVHWTHHDPQGRHETGWVKHNGHNYH
jgi:hypothetical protein